MKQITGAEALMLSLKAEGVTKIFGYLFLVLVGNLVEKKKMGLITTFYQERNLSKR